MKNNEFGVLDTNDPKEIKKMDDLLKKKYEESKGNKSQADSKKETA